MNITNEQIEEIAEWLECGMICFFHRPTGTIEYHPDPNDAFFEPEPWEDAMDKIDGDWDNYIRIDKMDSSEGFQVMEDFADELPDGKFRESVLEQLSNKKTFRNFKNMIDDSEYRQDWFDFKRKAYIEHVKQQLE